MTDTTNADRPFEPGDREDAMKPELDDWNEEAQGEWILRREAPTGVLVGGVSRATGLNAYRFNTHAYRNTGHLSVYTSGGTRCNREDACFAAEAEMDELASWFGWEKRTVHLQPEGQR